MFARQWTATETEPDVEAMMITLLLALAITSRNDDPGMDASQFTRIISALHADIRDVSLVYEGFFAGLKEGTRVEAAIPDKGAVYQGNYAYRSDGASLIDMFVTHKYRNPIYETHDTLALLRGRLASVSREPDQGYQMAANEPGGAGALNRPNSPERIIFLPFFRSMIDPQAYGYEYQGWEEVDGHRCLRVQFEAVPKALNRSPYHRTTRYWIDMERGGHPLKVEERSDDGPRGLAGRTVGIKLAQLPLPDGRLIWFPVAGRLETFVTIGLNTLEPVGVETYSLVDGTVRFNQDLPDEVFKLKWKGKLPETEKLAEQRRTFHEPPTRNDLPGITERLDRSLAKADKQSKQLEASAPADGEGAGEMVARMGLIGIGLAIVVGVVLVKRRRG